MSARRLVLLVAAASLCAFAVAAWQVGWAGLWASPDQRGRSLFAQDRYAEAASSFRDPMWRGAAQMRAGDFKAAADTFSGLDTAAGAYNEGNALVMLGTYEEAIRRYDRALALRPDWREAEANRTIARLRAERLKSAGGDAGEQREGADDIVYDKDAKAPGGERTQTAGAPMDDAAVRALWLRRVETKPADFLRARFGAQLEAQDRAGAGDAGAGR